MDAKEFANPMKKYKRAWKDSSAGSSSSWQTECITRECYGDAAAGGFGKLFTSRQDVFASSVSLE